MCKTFELLAFYSNLELYHELLDSGIDGIIIDWENKGKLQRQHLYNTQVNKHGLSDLTTVREASNINIICRINNENTLDQDEINKAIDHGADEVLLPMVKTVHEVENVLEVVNGRAKVGVMLETEEALKIAKTLNQLPVSRFFVGLNDLSIQRHSRNIFTPIVDGTIAELRPQITKPFGMAGLTHPQSGHPVPCTYLIHQMIHHRCTFGFLRRSFYKDLSKYQMSDIINQIRIALSIDKSDILEEHRSILSKAVI